MNAIENPQKFGHVLNGVMRSRGIKVLYIASPIDDWDFVENVKKSIHSENLVITGKDLEAFVDKIHAGCSKMENFHDNLSLVEQEICFRGQTFYASVGSSWSLNIMLERIAAGKM